MASREYAAIECVLFKDERFLRMDGDTRQTFVLLLGSQSRVRCPGLVEGNCVTVAQFLRHPLRVSDAGRFKAAIDASTRSIKYLVDLGWVEHDLASGVFFLPKAVEHNLPDNKNMLWRWIKTLKEFPSSPLIRRWVSEARGVLTSVFGRDDARSQLISHFARVYGGVVKLDVKEFLVQQKENDEGGNTVKTKVLNGYYEGYPDGVKDGLMASIRKAEIAFKGGEIQTSKPGRKKAPAPPPKKTTDPPEKFNPRQRELWALFLSEKFFVSGNGKQTVFENVSDPVALCEKLGGDGFKDVDLSLVYRLAAWSADKRKKRKKDLGAHLRNCFARDQKEAKAQKKIDAEQKIKRSNQPTFDSSNIPSEPTAKEKAARDAALAKAGLAGGGK